MLMSTLVVVVAVVVDLSGLANYETARQSVTISHTEAFERRGWWHLMREDHSSLISFEAENLLSLWQ